jgi:hypothetical protein
MSRPIAVVVADPHLDEIILRTRSEIRYDAFWGFEQAISKTIELNVPLILAGDNVECQPAETPTSTTVAFLGEQLARLTTAGLPIYWIDGQHDDLPSWIMAVCQEAICIHGRTVKIGDASFVGLSYRRTPVLSDWIAQLDKSADVVICHQVWQELMGGKGCQGSLKSLLPRKLIISGDYHRTKKITIKGQQNCLVVSPGATHCRKMNEPSDHYIAVVKSNLSVDFIKLNSRLQLKYAIDSDDDLDRLYATLGSIRNKIAEENTKRCLPAELQTPLMHVTDVSGLTGVERRLQELLGPYVHLFYNRELVGVDVPVEGATSAFDEEGDVPLIEFLADEVAGDTAVYELLSTAMLSPNPKSEISKWRAKFLQE